MTYFPNSLTVTPPTGSVHLCEFGQIGPLAKDREQNTVMLPDARPEAPLPNATPGAAVPPWPDLHGRPCRSVAAGWAFSHPEPLFSAFHRATGRGCHGRKATLIVFKVAHYLLIRCESNCLTLRTHLPSCPLKYTRTYRKIKITLWENICFS